MQEKGDQMTNEKEQNWNLDNSYTKLPAIYYSIISPNPVSSPQIVKLNKTLATSLGLNVEKLQEEEGIEVLAGNKIPEGGASLAQAYAGHQFGGFTMLGDGRALLIGEQLTPAGERFDLQLKGSGRTPYSRGGDGRAALGPMLREYIISEAMHALGIPTTRSLAVVLTGERIFRETELPGAILTRVGASHLRFGTFQYGANWGKVEDLKELADYALNRHYSHVEQGENPYLTLLEEVIKRHASLIAKWQLVGFIHGVMNTDNMTISGETIDYGPCAFMNEYDPETVFSSIDTQGRYSYGNQPGIGGWNLARFAEALLPLLHEDEEEALKLAQNAMEKYPEFYHQNWLSGMRRKLGLFQEGKDDQSLIEKLLVMMHKHKADYTNTFRLLTMGKVEDTVLYGKEEFTEWYKQWKTRIENQSEGKEAVEDLMSKNNPFVIPRNHLVEAALEAAVNKGDYTVMEELLDILSQPYNYAIETEKYCSLPTPSNRPYQTYCGT